MSKLRLPVLSISTSLEKAIEVMKQSDRGAVIVEEGDRYRMFSAANVAKGRGTGKELLSDIKKNSTPLEGVTLSPDSKGEEDSERDSYVDVDLDSSLANKLMSGPKLYYCTGNSAHEFPPPEVVAGERCPYDGSRIVSI
jgi:hypothetical protein